MNLDVSRKDYVLTAANKEGGAHVDPFFSPLYDALARENALGWTAGRTRDGVDENLGPPTNDPVLAALRQIAHEVLRTVDQHAWRLLDGPRMAPRVMPAESADLIMTGAEFVPVEPNGAKT